MDNRKEVPEAPDAEAANADQETLVRSRQEDELQEMLDDGLTVSVLAQYIPADRTYRVIRDAMYKKQVGLVLAYCTGIHFAQRNMLPLSRKLLSRRRA